MISTVSRNMQCLIASGLTIYFATRRFGPSADCEDCNTEHDGDCPRHGPLDYIHDTQLTDITECTTNRAICTLPQGLVVKESAIPNAGLGVWSEVEFPARVKFGPYGGEMVQKQQDGHESGYAWQIYKDGKPAHYIDAKDPAKSNWMRYVNCAETETQQHLVAFQYEGQIYYRSNKTIPANTELLVWYGAEYARELGMIRDKNLLIRPTYVNNEEVYPCVYCKSTSGAKFATVVKYIKHLIRQHSADRLTKDDILTYRSWLDRNNVNMTRNGSAAAQDKCDVCYKSFTCLSELQTHTLQSHQRLHTGNRPYRCDVCGKTFTQAGHLQVHQRLHTGDRPYKCDVCGKTFTQSTNLQSHQRLHTGDRPYKCDVCGKTFTRSCDLQRHQVIHTGNRPYKCDVCGKTFTWSSHLQRHQRLHTGDRPYKCDVCGKTFTQSDDLRKHQIIHTGDRPYKCDVCGKTFTQSTNLQSHQRIHTGDRPYKCDVCGKTFTQSTNLQSHQRIHTGDRPYKCDVCGKTCTQSGDLQRHQIIHTGDRPYRCDVCGKTCTRSSHLQKHQIIHTGDRPYKCDVCGKTFTRSDHLQVHQRIHTSDRPYRCDVCGKTFTRSTTLRRHQRIHTST